MSDEFTIRRAHPADANDIAEAHRDSIRSVGPQFYPPNVVQDWGEGLTPEIYVNAMQGGEVFFIALGPIENEPRVLGFASHRIDDAQDGGSVYVRGKATRRGIGSALLGEVEAHAIAKGAMNIHVEASLAGLASFLVAGAGLLAPVTILNAQEPEPGRYSGRVAVQDVTSSQGTGVVEQGNDPAAISRPMRRSVSINSSYFTKFYTNTQIADVGLDIVTRFGSHWCHQCPARFQREHDELHAMLIDEFALAAVDPGDRASLGSAAGDLAPGMASR